MKSETNNGIKLIMIL